MMTVQKIDDALWRVVRTPHWLLRAVGFAPRAQLIRRTPHIGDRARWAWHNAVTGCDINPRSSWIRSISHHEAETVLPRAEIHS